MANTIYNFSAGPSVLPKDALATAGAEILNYKDSGQSVMEMSHRSAVFVEIFEETKSTLINLLNVPDTHEVLFLQGGATTQFAAVPLNLIGRTGVADYAVTGNFSGLAYKEAAKFGTINLAASSENTNFTYIPKQNELNVDPNASYFHYCANNTIYGSEWKYIPVTGDVPLVADMSSNILTQEVNVSRYGVIYAGAQKNMAPAGVTLVIVRKDLAGSALPYTPVMLDYAAQIKGDSMHNTPPCWAIYMLGLVLKWIEANGGIAGMEQLKRERSGLLYDYLDNSDLFSNPVNPKDRSFMNIPFITGDAAIDADFIKSAEAHGLVNIAGHRKVGGMRASMYNAMPVEGAQELVTFMKDFESKQKTTVAVGGTAETDENESSAKL
ncbi:MAG: 3-phosphoserine/phosphohydroxythreonine transaminase [Oscillospiraceae bacterium]|jgi:phosphoserine aminotransferase|nr:3-phosphoserine/phosphohydroxythreonine transaminase [Oscillospiraceae bacterium]